MDLRKNTRSERKIRRRKKGYRTPIRNLTLFVLIGAGSAAAAFVGMWILAMETRVVVSMAVIVPLGFVTGFLAGSTAGMLSIYRFVYRNRAPNQFAVGVPQPHASIHKESLFETKELGIVFEIRHFPHAEAMRALVLTGGYGVQFLDADGKAGEHIPISTREHLKSLKTVGTGPNEPDGFIAINRSEDVLRYDADGRLRWRDPHTKLSNRKVHPADIDGDGASEFLVEQMNLHYVLDADGKTRWCEERHSMGMTAFNAGALGDEAVIVSGGVSDGLTFMDSAGRILRHGHLKGDVQNLAQCKWPTHDGSPHLLVVDWQQGLVHMYDPLGNLVAMYRTEYSTPGATKIAATPVRLFPDAPEAFAFIVNGGKGTTLYIFDHQRQPIYIECFADRTTAIAAIPEPGTDTESLLVGGEGKVWRYRFRESGGG